MVFDFHIRNMSSFSKQKIGVLLKLSLKIEVKTIAVHDGVLIKVLEHDRGRRVWEKRGRVSGPSSDLTPTRG